MRLPWKSTAKMTWWLDLTVALGSTNFVKSIFTVRSRLIRARLSGLAVDPRARGALIEASPALAGLRMTRHFFRKRPVSQRLVLPNHLHCSDLRRLRAGDVWPACVDLDARRGIRFGRHRNDAVYRFADLAVHRFSLTLLLGSSRSEERS